MERLSYAVSANNVSSSVMRLQVMINSVNYEPYVTLLEKS